MKEVKYEGADSFETSFYGGIWISTLLGPYDISDISGPIGHPRGKAKIITKPSAKAEIVTGFTVWDNDNGLVAKVSGLAISRSAFDAGLGVGTANEGNVSFTYPFLVSLLNGNLSVVGSKFDDRFLEVGAGGMAKVKSGGGNDSLYVWHGKTIHFDGGKGADTILFQGNGNTPYPTPATQPLVVDLSKGKGKNPYGGKLKLEKVENVVGTAGADKITGNNKANIIGDGVYDAGADIVKAKGGKDIVKVASVSVGVKADGGKGKDELRFSVDQVTTANEATTVLDLDHPGNNTGPMAGNVFKGFEIFTATQFGGYLHHLDFRGSSRGETVVGVSGFYGSTDVKGADKLDGRGGDDTLDGRGGPDILIGGPGKDTFLFTFGLVAGNVDTIVDFVSGTDTIAISSFVFGAAGKVGKLAAAKFNALSKQDGNDAILYEKASGRVFYDSDGSGGAAPVHFATLANNADLKAGDFIIV